MKSYLKVILFSLWENNFTGLATALKANKCHSPQLSHFVYCDPKFPCKVNINKTDFHTGKIGRDKEKQR